MSLANVETVEICEIPPEFMISTEVEFDGMEELETHIPPELVEFQVRNHMAELGLAPAETTNIVMDGNEHFYQTQGDPAGKMSGVYRVDILAFVPTWYIQNWNTGVKFRRDFEEDYEYKPYTETPREKQKKYMKKIGIPEPAEGEKKTNPSDGWFASAFLAESMGAYIYVPADGFYKYSEKLGIWEKQPDEFIKRAIIDSIGIDAASNSRVNNIFNILKNMICTKEPMNPHNKLVLRNGTLNLDTFALEEHNKENYATVCVNYDYDPDAKCPNWEKFISNVAAEDITRVLALQEAAGYVFFRESPIQAGVFLIGRGANGKSIYLEILKKIIGKHYAKVDISSLDQPFQVIQLRYAWADISTELKTDKSTTEAAFKSLVAGEDMSGCFKYKDFITFTPRAKLIMACNEFPKWRELTGAMLRRMVYVKFTRRYVDHANPKATNQQEADAYIIRKLSAELPGILNWMLAGKQRLASMERPAFTKTKDYFEMIAQYQETADPVYAFLLEFRRYMEGRVLKKTDVYKFYKEWAKKTGHKAASNRNFYTSIKRIFEYECGAAPQEVTLHGFPHFRFPEDFFFLDDCEKDEWGEEKMAKAMEYQRQERKNPTPPDTFEEAQMQRVAEETVDIWRQPLAKKAIADTNIVTFSISEELEKY